MSVTRYFSLDSDPENNKLTADLIFTSLSLFNLVRTPLTLFPFALMDTIKLFVRCHLRCNYATTRILGSITYFLLSVKRIKDFLNAEELEEFTGIDGKVCA